MRPARYLWSKAEKSRALASPGSRRGWKALPRDREERSIASKQFREVAMLWEASGSCRRGLHLLLIALMIVAVAGFGVQSANAGSADKTGNNAEVYLISTTPDIVPPGMRPEIKGYVHNTSSVKNGNDGKSIFKILAVLTAPDGSKKGLTWNNVNFSNDQRKYYLFTASFDTAGTGTYSITYSVYNVGRTHLYSSATRSFLVKAPSVQTAHQKQPPQKKAEQPPAQPSSRKQTEQRVFAGLGGYLNTVNPGAGGTLIVWPLNNIAVQGTYGGGTFTSYEARIFYRMNFFERLHPYIGAGYIHAERKATVIGVDTTFKASSFTGFAGVEIPLYKNMYAYADVSGTPLKMSQNVQSGGATATATVDYSAVTVNLALVLYLF